MPLQIHSEKGEPFTVIEATGTLKHSDYKHFVSDFEHLVDQHGKLRILFDMTRFEGWEANALWPEIKFDVKHSDDIEKMAAVGSKNWEKDLMKLANPFAKAEVKYFDEPNTDAARTWLAQP
jgi:hypothetical protein